MVVVARWCCGLVVAVVKVVLLAQRLVVVLGYSLLSSLFAEVSVSAESVEKGQEVVSVLVESFRPQNRIACCKERELTRWSRTSRSGREGGRKGTDLQISVEEVVEGLP